MIFEEAVIDLIDVRKVVSRFPVLVFIVDTDFVMEDRVEAYVLKVRDAFRLPEVAAIALSQRQNRATGAKHLLPEMGKGMERSRGVNFNRRRRSGRLRDELPGI